ncbi:MAG: peptidoglycan DD-metalloendopeptidase family protein [Actinomycetota bacterium]
MSSPSRRTCARLSLVLACLVGTASSLVARADTSSELEEARDRLEVLRGQITDEESQLTELQARLNSVAAEIERARTAVERTESDIASIEERISQSLERLVRLKDRLGERAANAYMSGPATNLEMILGAESVAELSDRLVYIEAVGRQDAELATAVENQRFELETREGELDRLLRDQRDRLDGLADQQESLDAKFEEQSDLVAHLASIRAEANDLVERLEERLEQELAAIPPPSSSGSGDGIPGPLYACPVNGSHAYADTFGETHVHEGWTHMHTGNDIMAPFDTPIVAPFDGVAVDGSDSTAGIYVTVTGSQGFVQMLHMSSVAQLGQVSTGDVVGYVGTTGNASGPHTHFEWHPDGGAAADPYPQLNEVC